jgi:hypothetical protein
MMTVPTDDLSFVHDGRTFTCRIEGSAATGRGPWWWFAVSTEAHQRHAPFPAVASDTLADVQARIVAYHDGWLARRAAPVENPWQARARQRQAERQASAVVAAPPA